MKWIALSNQLELHIGACVATIGNFDGVHVGHQALLKTLVRTARKYKLPSVVVLFEPHPREFLQGDLAPKRLSLLPDKLTFLQEYGVDGILLLPFNRRIAAQSPLEFIHETLLKKLGVRFLVIGEDFRFGRDREGTLADIEAAGIHVEVVPAFQQDGQRVSSTLLRKCIAKGDFKALAQFSNHGYTITGKVTHGAEQGRLLGFPTLNIALKRKLGVHGVYAVRVWGLEERTVFSGVANVGRRPSVNPLLHPLLEVYVFDYVGDAYQQRVAIEFVEKIRDEKKFESLDALKAQIADDVTETKKRMKKWTL